MMDFAGVESERSTGRGIEVSKLREKSRAGTNEPAEEFHRTTQRNYDREEVVGWRRDRAGDAGLVQEPVIAD